MAEIRAANQAADQQQTPPSTMSMGYIESLSHEELFAFPLPWNQIQALGDTFLTPLRKWVAEKTVEYLGEPEESMIDFVMDQVKDGEAASAAILEEMEMVLDDAAEDFVIQLWQILVVPQLWLSSLVDK
jgi:hypothetical protein